MPFQVPEKVTWTQLAQALNTKFMSSAGLGLSPENLLYLASKLFGQADDYSMQMVAWSQFNRVSQCARLLIQDISWLMSLWLAVGRDSCRVVILYY